MTTARICVLVVLLLAVLLPLALVAWSPASAADSEVVVEVGKTVTIMLPRQPMLIGVEDEEIASMEVLPDGHARVHGKRVGKTRIVGRDYAHVPIIIPVTVRRGP